MISFQTANRTLHMKDAEVQDSQARILGLSDEVNRLRKLVETSQVCVCVYGLQLVLVIQVNLQIDQIKTVKIYLLELDYDYILNTQVRPQQPFGFRPIHFGNVGDIFENSFC